MLFGFHFLVNLSPAVYRRLLVMVFLGIYRSLGDHKGKVIAVLAPNQKHKTLLNYDGSSNSGMYMILNYYIWYILHF